MGPVETTPIPSTTALVTPTCERKTGERERGWGEKEREREREGEREGGRERERGRLGPGPLPRAEVLHLPQLLG